MKFKVDDKIKVVDYLWNISSSRSFRERHNNINLFTVEFYNGRTLKVKEDVNLVSPEAFELITDPLRDLNISEEERSLLKKLNNEV